MEENVEHLQQVFWVLRWNQLFVKKEKHSFTQSEVNLLNHIVWEDTIKMDSAKIQTIIIGKQPSTKASTWTAFLPRAGNYYWKHIKGYLEIASSFTDMLKKIVWWDRRPENSIVTFILLAFF